MKNLVYISILCSLSLVCCNDKQSIPMDILIESLIPLPVSIEARGGSFEITKNTNIYSTGDLITSAYLAKLLSSTTGFQIEVKPMIDNPRTGDIYLYIDENGNLEDEAYILDIDHENVKIKAKTENGLFYAIQTFRQLLPDEIHAASQSGTPILIATGIINDKPNYAYRGAMLDVSRHFFSVADVKRYIDLISAYKLNTLHLHLSDDQGWRIEIKSWPNLTAHGGSTQVGGGKGGFYTQEEYQEIVSYATDRFVTIIPEIDMPGHTNAALSSYPELNCNNEAPDLYTGIDVGFSTLCTDKEIVYTFIDNVIEELAALTPGTYIHIGGDESHATDIEDYIPFINRVQDIVHKHGKKIMGWDEIAHADLTPEAIVQYWNKAENAKMGIVKNAKVVMSPASRTYLDMQYDSTTHLGLHWAAYIEVEDAYNWDPAELAEGISRKDIHGIESPLWTETITTMDEIEFMAFPRITGHAEIGWTPQSLRKWDNFRSRLGGHHSYFKTLDINYYQSSQIEWKPVDTVGTAK